MRIPGTTFSDTDFTEDRSRYLRDIVMAEIEKQDEKIKRLQAVVTRLEKRVESLVVTLRETRKMLVRS